MTSECFIDITVYFNCWSLWLFVYYPFILIYGETLHNGTFLPCDLEVMSSNLGHSLSACGGKDYIHICSPNCIWWEPCTLGCPLFYFIFPLVAFDSEIFVVLIFNCLCSFEFEFCFSLFQLLIRVQEVGSWSMMSLKQLMNLFKTYLLAMNK